MKKYVGALLTVALVAALVLTAPAYTQVFQRFVGEVVFHEDESGNWNDSIDDKADAISIIPGTGIVWEGATDDANQMTWAVEDVTADVGITWKDDKADTYHPLTIPDGDVTGGFFTHPAIGGDDAVTTSGDNVLLCSRVYIPQWLTVGAAYARNVIAADSGSDDTLGIAIYEDADAGVRLATGKSADASSTENVEIDFTDVTLGPGMYRLCGCAQDVSGGAFHAATLDDETIDIVNSGASVTFGTGANSCSTGDPPTTTGALTTADDNIPVIMLAADSS